VAELGVMRYFNTVLLVFTLVTVRAQEKAFDTFCNEFAKAYDELGIPATELSYKANFKNVPQPADLEKQEAFMKKYSAVLERIGSKKLTPANKIRYKQLKYEMAHHQERIALEKKWNKNGRMIPDSGLHALEDYKGWYSYYIKHFTSVNISPQQVFKMGEREVTKAKREIDSIRILLGFKNENEFYRVLAADSFYITSREKILVLYSKIDSTVRNNLGKIFSDLHPPEVTVTEWPDAGPNTPPGMYSDREYNSQGKDIFEFNFYNKRHNCRCMQWLYMHEAIPGHHLQSTIALSRKETPLNGRFFYFGNSEGWACYIEDFGKEMGLYKDAYSYLGKCEWDLVRSARLVMEVGIHNYGWSFDKAKNYWKENIKGQDEIADREIRRITNWAGQALCYKVGALTIKQIVSKRMQKGESMKQVHEMLLQNSDVPLQVLLEEA
jgi:uncharacterized protein (DUF885 family)